jgi:hypothetical protein
LLKRNYFDKQCTDWKFPAEYEGNFVSLNIQMQMSISIAVAHGNKIKKKKKK